MTFGSGRYHEDRYDGRDFDLPYATWQKINEWFTNTYTIARYRQRLTYGEFGVIVGYLKPNSTLCTKTANHSSYPKGLT